MCAIFIEVNIATFQKHKVRRKDSNEVLSSEHHIVLVLSCLQLLWSPAQDLHNIQPNTQALVGEEGLRGSTPPEEIPAIVSYREGRGSFVLRDVAANSHPMNGLTPSLCMQATLARLVEYFLRGT